VENAQSKTFSQQNDNDIVNFGYLWEVWNRPVQEAETWVPPKIMPIHISPNHSLTTTLNT